MKIFQPYNSQQSHEWDVEVDCNIFIVASILQKMKSNGSKEIIFQLTKTMITCKY